MADTDEDLVIDVDDDDFASGTILPRVEQLISRIGRAEEQDRYQRFFRAASVAIERLGELDVSGSDTEDPDASGGLAFWEALAPAVTNTLKRVAGFLELVRTEFPITEAEQDVALDAAFDDAFAFDAPAPKQSEAARPRDSLQDAAKTLHSFCSNLTRDLHALEDALKTPTLMTDRWNLLERLGEFRGRARAAIGEMVFVAARLFAVVRKEDVVPFYREDVNSSLALRRSMAAMRRRTDVQRARLERLNVERDDRAARECLREFVSEFDGFTTTDVYRSLRAADRRTFLQVRRDLKKLSQHERLEKLELANMVEGVSRFLDSLSLMNQRELLVIHDRETIGEIERHLGATVDAIVATAIGDARAALKRALSACEKLAGREPTFDVLLALFAHAELDRYESADILAMAQLLRRQL
jgi:hypothetical protein